jgi:lipopolysaccharide heptosyltransferase II
MKILVVRPDRIGDVILSTPVFDAIREHSPSAHLSVMVRSQVLPILKDLDSVNQWLVYDPSGVHSGWLGLLRLVTEIRKQNFEAVVVLQSNLKLACAIYLAGVPQRVGPWSKFHSYLFYNLGVRQKRSQVEMHESDYNLQLLTRLGWSSPSRKIPTRIAVPSETQVRATQWLRIRGWNSEAPLILVHPGMGGSALNWPEDKYIELIRNLLQEGRQVLISGGPLENPLLDRIRSQLTGSPGRVIFFRSEGSVTSQSERVDFLAALIRLAQVVIAPSTGPLHIAVALGIPVVTFYPPIRVQTPKRWGPYLPDLKDRSRASVLVPEVRCEQEFKCLGSTCQYFPCMNTLTLEQTLTQVQLQLESNHK